MAASATPLLTGGPSPETMTGQVKIEFEPNPQKVGGFLLEREDGSKVDIEVTTLDEDVYRGGTTRLDNYKITEIASDEEGSSESTYSYNARTNLPRQLRSNTLAEATTAWTTREGGFNAKLMRGMNDKGYATMFIEPRGRSISASLIDASAHVNYVGSVARNFRQVSDELRPDEIVYVGPSRAAAIGFGVSNSAYSDLLASCFINPGKLSELPNDAKQLGVELFEAVKHAGSLGPRELIDHRTTFSMNPVDLAHTILAIRHLRSGQTGEMLRSNDAGAVNLTLFDQDGWSQHEDTLKELEHRPNIYATVHSGRHLSLAHPAVIQSVFDRFDMVAEMRGFDGSFKEVDFETVASIQPVFDERRSLIGSISGQLGVGKVFSIAQSLASIS